MAPTKTAIKKKPVKKTPAPKNFNDALATLIDECGLSKSFIAEKIGMPWGTFKNKLNPNTPAYNFTDDERNNIGSVIGSIHEATGQFFWNRAKLT